MLGWKTELKKLIETEIKKIEEKEKEDEKNVESTSATITSINDSDEATKSVELDKSIDEKPTK